MKQTLAEEIADMIWHIQGNYQREGAGPGSRFEGRTLEAVQAEAVIRRVRASVAGEMRRAAEGRRHYARNAPGAMAEVLATEANAFDNAAKIAEDDPHVMLGLLPVVMWNDAEQARTEQP